jgi:hypothetical protein
MVLLDLVTARSLDRARDQDHQPGGPASGPSNRPRYNIRPQIDEARMPQQSFKHVSTLYVGSVSGELDSSEALLNVVKLSDYCVEFLTRLHPFGFKGFNDDLQAGETLGQHFSFGRLHALRILTDKTC